jgi:hypothetical protein
METDVPTSGVRCLPPLDSHSEWSRLRRLSWSYRSQRETRENGGQLLQFNGMVFELSQKERRGYRLLHMPFQLIQMLIVECGIRNGNLKFLFRNPQSEFRNRNDEN